MVTGALTQLAGGMRMIQTGILRLSGSGLMARVSILSQVVT